MPGIGVRAARILLPDRRRLGVRLLRSPGRLRVHRPGHPHLRFLDQGRTPGPHRQPQARTRLLPGRVRRAVRPHQQGYHDRKRAEGTKHNAALICLARRHCDVLFAMLRDKAYYRHPEPVSAPTAA
nr:hypothetical protein GCM10020241_14360 [Streptoalloteichus tenebrarius]